MLLGENWKMKVSKEEFEKIIKEVYPKESQTTHYILLLGLLSGQYHPEDSVSS